MGFICALVDNDLALAISVPDFGGPLVKSRPVQALKRRVVEVAFDDVADEGRLTIALGTRQVELAPAVYRTVAVSVGFALKYPLISHPVAPPPNSPFSVSPKGLRLTALGQEA